VAQVSRDPLCGLKQSIKQGNLKMTIARLVEKLDIKSNFTKLMVGSILVALTISLRMVGISRLFNFSISPAIPSVFAAIGAATYAARMRK